MKTELPPGAGTGAGAGWGACGRGTQQPRSPQQLAAGGIRKAAAEQSNCKEKCKINVWPGVRMCSLF